MKSEGNSYEGRGVLEAHGYTCVIDGTVVSVKPPNPFSSTTHKGVHLLNVGDKDPELGFHLLALFFAGLGEAFSGWSKSLPVVVERGGRCYFWGDVYG